LLAFLGTTKQLGEKVPAAHAEKGPWLKAKLNPWAFFVRLKPHAPSDGRKDVFFTKL
jgi:hypothetical protein